jgi:hypothetical protein
MLRSIYMHSVSPRALIQRFDATPAGGLDSDITPGHPLFIGAGHAAYLKSIGQASMVRWRDSGWVLSERLSVSLSRRASTATSFNNATSSIVQRPRDKIRSFKLFSA